MTITGRLTADAAVNTTKDERKVVNFSVAINDRYKKGGEVVKTTTYCNCSYWISEKLAEHLRKSTLVEITGRIYVTPYVGKDGTAKASLNCHVSNVKILAWPKEAADSEQPVKGAETATANADDVPF
jgi:single-strand DNA-binding protein